MNTRDDTTGRRSPDASWIVRWLTLVSAGLFMFMATLLPLVGPAGVRTPHYRQNFNAFFAVLFAAWVTALFALWLWRRAPERAPAGRWPLWLSLVGLFMLWALFAGWIHT